uniref:THAP-type domain-containing protein n=1 Tax=Photinus pyralis TaxID=7054 RepID=A0A1Y1NDD9_PHOPY
MPKVCLVPFCKMREPTQGIKFFRLTSDRRVLWLPALGRNREDDISAHNVICSLHFSSASFLPNGKLKKDALPTLKLKPGKPGFTSFRRHLEHHLRFIKTIQNHERRNSV